MRRHRRAARVRAALVHSFFSVHTSCAGTNAHVQLVHTSYELRTLNMSWCAPFPLGAAPQPGTEHGGTDGDAGVAAELAAAAAAAGLTLDAEAAAASLDPAAGPQAGAPAPNVVWPLAFEVAVIRFRFDTPVHVSVSLSALFAELPSL